MVRLLIVDDERIIRDGLQVILDWEAYGIQVIGTERNGRDALETVRKERPDIVITDIKMPLMDGLGLIAACRGEGLTGKVLGDEIFFVVLSGYGEFELAHQAMYHGVRHYLLKPCREQKLVETVRDVLEVLEQRRRLRLGLGREEDSPLTEGTTVERIVRYVAEHLDDPELNLKKIAAEHLFMHPTYVSKLFHSRTGERFSQYLLRKRMEHARRLIGASDEVRVYEIAGRVGWGDNPQYFSQLFKKSTGMSPTEYKRSLVDTHK